MILVSVVPGRDDVVEGGGVGDVFVGASADESVLEVAAVRPFSAGKILLIFASVEDFAIFWDDPKLLSAVSFKDLAGCRGGEESIDADASVLSESEACSNSAFATSSCPLSPSRSSRTESWVPPAATPDDRAGC